MHTGCSVATPKLVYVWPEKDEFDKLDVAEKLHDWTTSKVITVIKNDGHEWERRCHVKVIESAGIMVIFQYFDERPKKNGDAGNDQAAGSVASGKDGS